MTRALAMVSTLLPLLAGCIPTSISTRVLEPVRPPRAMSVAMLAVMPGVSEPGSEWVRPETMDGLVQGLAERFPGMVLLEPEEAAETLAAQSLATDYATLLGDFERAGVIDAERLDRVLDALGATHLLQVRAEYASERRQKVEAGFDGDAQVYQAKRQVFEVVFRLWRSGATVPSWEAVARSESERGWFTQDRDPSELVESLVDSVVRTIPLDGAVTSPD